MKALSCSPATWATYTVTSAESIVTDDSAKDMMGASDKGRVARNPHLRGVVVWLLPRERIKPDDVSSSLMALVSAWYRSDLGAKDLHIIISLVGGSLRAISTTPVHGQPAPVDEFNGDAPRTDDIHIRAGPKRLPVVDGRIDRKRLQCFQVLYRFYVEMCRRVLYPSAPRMSHTRYNLRERRAYKIVNQDDGWDSLRTLGPRVRTRLA